MERVVTFLLTTQADAALSFYRDRLGLRFLRDDGFALVFDLNGVMLRIARVPSFAPAANTVLGWDTSDIVGEVSRLAAQGIVFERYPGMTFDEHSVCSFPNGDKVAWFKDPDGNVLSLSQHAAQ